MLVTGGVVRSIHGPVVLAEEPLVLGFGEVLQDHQRIGGVFRWLCGHATQLRPPAVLRLLPPHLPGRECTAGPRLDAARIHQFRRPPRSPRWPHSAMTLISEANQIPGAKRRA